MKSKITAAELMTKLNADPAFIAKQADEEQRRRQRMAEWRRAEEPLVEELRAAGFEVESAWELVNTGAAYPAALPILLAHLQRRYPGPVLEGIARALAVPEARFAWDILTRLYREEEEPRPKDGLAVALAASANDDLIGDVISLARDTRHGPSRLLLLSALECSTDARARAALADLAEDPELAKEIRVILRRLQRAKR